MFHASLENNWIKMILKGTKKVKYLLILVFLNVQVYAQQTQVQYLSGTDAHSTVSWDFYCSDGMNSKQWKRIEVPSCWEQQGFGQYQYGHDPFNERLKETGTYRHHFTVPKTWKNKEVNIVFEGVMTDASVKINGKNAGEVHQGAFYEFEYDISKLLKFGSQNIIEVEVKKFSANESVNFAERKSDFWLFGGIFRPVYLQASPKGNIQRVAIDAKADGSFNAAVFTSKLKKGTSLEVDIQTPDGITIATFKEDNLNSITAISGSVQSPNLWNPESPSLYQAIFRLKSSEKILHQHRERFGFRTVEVREQDGIYINDIKVKLKGVNRHTFHPDYGRTSSKKLSIEAVTLMKEMNMNAVRMSHYPPEKHFLEVCDSLGLFVIDELTGWQEPAYDETVGRKLLTEMIARDVNHPSIILWSNGNEGGWNDALNEDFSKLDIQKRTVIHPWQTYGKTNTKHYISYNYLGLDGYAKRSIYLPTEFLHGLYDGGHGAGLEDFWLRLWNHPLAAGGFLWVFADEGIARSDRNGEIDLDGNHAPDGILSPYLEKEASFYSIKKVWSPIFIEKRYITSEFNGVFSIENRYHFTNLDQGKFKVEWVRYNRQNKAEIVANETITIDLEPDQKGKLKIALPTDWNSCHTLKITAKDKLSNSINTWSYPVQQASKILTPPSTNEMVSEVELLETNAEYRVNVGKVTYNFSKENGMLSAVNSNGKNIPFTNGPVFVSQDKKVEKVVRIKEKDSTVSIVAIYKKHADSVVWNIQKSGLLELKVAYTPAKNTPYAGISFSFPETQVSGMQWMGQGPYRVWKNRKQETSFGLWEKQYNNTITGHSNITYPEFKGYHSEVYWAEIKTRNDTGFKVYIKSNDIFLRMLTPEFPEDGRNTIVTFPTGDISFLHGINAIGTKFKDAGATGPQASKNQFNPRSFHGEKLKMHLVFDFEH